MHRRSFVKTAVIGSLAGGGVENRMHIFMRLVIAVLLLASFAGLKAQRGAGYSSINRIMSRIPDSLTRSTNGIAHYVNSRFSTQREKSRAIFIWIAKNIQYNFESMFDNSIYETPSAVSERILKTRIGVCLQYANLFTEIAVKAGIKSYVIQGYTQQEGRIAYIPHVWCAAFIDSAWYLFDPTWGSGYIVDGVFIKQVNNFYFMTKPEDMIKSHMPFDPLWQFLNYPVTNQDFYERNFRIDTSKSFFNFQDTLNTYEYESENEQYVSSARRIEQNGVKNSFIEAKLRVLNGKVAYYRNKTAADRYNSAVDLYNEGIQKLNRFIHYRNSQYETEWDSVQLTQMLDSTEYLFNTAVETIKGMAVPDESLAASINLLINAIFDTRRVLDEQKTSLFLYLKTWR